MQYYRKEDIERELEEFQENSQLLEKELEASLEQAEKNNRELRQRNTRLATEVEQLRTRLDQQTADCAMFQGKAQDLQTQHDHLLKYIRELEQKNDDLERAHRYLKIRLLFLHLLSKCRIFNIICILPILIL